MSKVPSSRSRQVFRVVHGMLGLERPPVYPHYDADESHRVDIVYGIGAPTKGFSSYVTVTLNEYPNVLEGKDIPTEIFMVASGEDEDVPNALSSCAFNLIKDGWLIAPGVVHREVMAMYEGLAPHLPHVLFVPPMDYGSLAKIETDDGEVYGLQAIPISDAEAEFLYDNGLDELEKRFEEANLDYTNLKRASIIAQELE